MPECGVELGHRSLDPVKLVSFGLQEGCCCDSQQPRWQTLSYCVHVST
ncbi:unnamed protein product [Staurois parvus]|uniref:Uncharacterized protein n=1 Tax=Staurois parvus TaxID=386267 RepID=A0ABN9FPL8_9NEOB|nr:unnamed protein product [Staurois parvus]